jgi:hypothetical protein
VFDPDLVKLLAEVAPHIDLAALLEDYPARQDRRDGALFVSKHFFPVAARSLEKWDDLAADERYVNGRITLSTRQLVESAARRLAARTTPPNPRAAREDSTIAA